jgi:hypothetical protein
MATVSYHLEEVEIGVFFKRARVALRGTVLLAARQENRLRLLLLTWEARRFQSKTPLTFTAQPVIAPEVARVCGAGSVWPRAGVPKKCSL